MAKNKIHLFVFEGNSGHPTDKPQWSHPFAGDWNLSIGTNFKNYTWNYYSQRESGIRRALKKFENLPSSDTVLVLGFSNGGHAAILFASIANELKRKIKLVVTCDPIKKTRYWYIPDKKVFVTTPNVKRWVNYYQRCDTKSIAGRFPAKGNSIANADVDVLLPAKVFRNPKKAHTQISSNVKFLVPLLDELGKAGLERKITTVSIPTLPIPVSGHDVIL